MSQASHVSSIAGVAYASAHHERRCNCSVGWLGTASLSSAQSQNVYLANPSGGPDGTGGGDLTINFSCTLTVSVEGAWAQMDLYISVDGQEIEHRYYEVYDYYEVTLNESVPASPQNRGVACWVSGTLGFAATNGTIQGSGPGSATVKIDTFIPANWIMNPGNYFRVFGGDDRSFDYFGGSSRMVTVYDVFNPAVNDGDVLSGPFHQTGMTQEYDYPTSLDAMPPYGRLTSQAINDWTWDDTLKTRWAMADTSGMSCTSPTRLGHPSDQTSAHEFRCTAQASDPLIWSPYVRWDLTIRLTWGLNKIHFEISGCHSYFPHFEAYLSGGVMFQHVGSNSPSDMFYGCASGVSASGDVQ